MTPDELPAPLVLPDVDAWRAWLDAHEDSSDGVWLVLAKKGKASPTTLTYQDALEEAMCSGWIDGQRRTLDEHSFRQRFTPRRRRSIWSQRNVEIIARLEGEGRMRERGRAEVALAEADGRWENAYAGPATAEPPPALLAALEASPDARAAFDRLTRTARFSALHPVLTARDERTRERRIAALVAKLQREDEQAHGSADGWRGGRAVTRNAWSGENPVPWHAPSPPVSAPASLPMTSTAATGRSSTSPRRCSTRPPTGPSTAPPCC
jgi:uncharacterized protein YdeI (YjbR/CyaY-like superfamily)